MSAAKIIQTLWSATRDRLTDEQLEALSCGEELALNLSAIADTMDGIAALVANDTDTGNFQDKEDVSRMLWGFSWAVKAAAEAVFVANEAQGIRLARAEGFLKRPAS